MSDLIDRVKKRYGHPWQVVGENHWRYDLSSHPLIQELIAENERLRAAAVGANVGAATPEQIEAAVISVIVDDD